MQFKIEHDNSTGNTAPLSHISQMLLMNELIKLLAIDKANKNKQKPQKLTFVNP